MKYRAILRRMEQRAPVKRVRIRVTFLDESWIINGEDHGIPRARQADPNPDATLDSTDKPEKE